MHFLGLQNGFFCPREKKLFYFPREIKGFFCPGKVVSGWLPTTFSSRIRLRYGFEPQNMLFCQKKKTSLIPVRMKNSIQSHGHIHLVFFPAFFYPRVGFFLPRAVPSVEKPHPRVKKMREKNSVLCPRVEITIFIKINSFLAQLHKLNHIKSNQICIKNIYALFVFVPSGLEVINY